MRPSEPSPAIQRGPQGTYVYLAQPDNTVKIQVVTLALASGNSVGVSSGVQPGDTIVVDGQDKLQDGSKIEARAPGGGPANQSGRPAQGQDQTPQSPASGKGKRQ